MLENSSGKLSLPKVIWFTGLPGSGKTTLGQGLTEALRKKGILSYMLDGDRLRNEVNAGLGFSDEDRQENIRIAAWIARYLHESGVNAICCFVSPTEKIRDIARDIIGKDNICMVYASAPLDVCAKRQKQDLYRQAREGTLREFTGISAPFEEPVGPDLVIDTAGFTVEQSLQMITDHFL